MSEVKQKAVVAEFLTGFLADKLPLYSFVVGGIGVLLSLFLYTKDAHRFFFSYLTNFLFFLTMTLGCLFFVIIQFLVRAGWSVAIRRVPEVVMKNLWIMGILFIPVLLGIPDLYHWTHADATVGDHILQHKSPFLNVPFFLIRVVVFFAIWKALSWLFFKSSTDQDKSGDKALTLKLQKIAAVSVLLYALSQTFAFVDWVMSLTPHWYSTMFGVYFFAGSAVSGWALINVIHLVLRRFGFLKSIVTVEHHHDIGKFMYGLNIFWSYIAFGQYFLIWYANIPEEIVWYMQHFKGSWNTAAAILAIGHFGIPFIFFMSRHTKRNLTFSFCMSIWILMMHYLDMYWVVMPNVCPNGVSIGLVDISTFLAIGGICVGVLFNRMKKYSLFPVQDPRLHESISHHT